MLSLGDVASTKRFGEECHDDKCDFDARTMSERKASDDHLEWRYP